MIDNFALGLTHALILLVAWRLMTRADLDAEGEIVRPPFGKRPRA